MDNENKILEIEIKTFEDFNNYLEKFDIEWTSNTGGFCRKILNAAFKQGIETCIIKLADCVIPPSYVKSSGAAFWCKRTLEGKTLYPHLQTSHPYGQKTLTLKGSIKEIPKQKFRTELMLKLRASEKRKIYVSLDDMPRTYINQPYLLRTLLRREGFHNATTLNIGNSLLISYEKPEKKTVTVYEPEY